MSGKYIKYSKTPHFPWSKGRHWDDIGIGSIPFVGKNVVVTEKMDGECTSIYSDHFHARSLDSRMHISRGEIAQLQMTIGMDIPEGMRICGENVFAKHSIFYPFKKGEVPYHFLVFGIYRDDVCLSWKETVEWCELFGLKHVPVLYEGIWDEKKVKACYTGVSFYRGWEENPALNSDFITAEEIKKIPLTIAAQEGYVVRTTDSFPEKDFQNNVAKFVRKNHIKTSDHWMSEAIVRNVE